MDRIGESGIVFPDHSDVQEEQNIPRRITFNHLDPNPVVAQLCTQEKFNAFFAEFYRYITDSQSRMLTELYAAEGYVLYLIRVRVEATESVADRMLEVVGQIDQRFAVGIEETQRLNLQKTRCEY